VPFCGQLAEWLKLFALLASHLGPCRHSLRMREFADRDLTAVLSEPTELIRDFKEEDEFEKLIREVDRENAHDAKRRGRASMKETY
jgi:hypothetical protein